MSGNNSLPVIRNSSSGVIIRHKEFLCDIHPSIAFKSDSFPLNPGQSKTFPWLSTVATQFEQFELRGCVFQFRSLSSDTFTTTAGNTSLGTVIMATEYNAYDDDFNDKIEMENSEFANSCKPSCSILHPIECARGLSTLTRLYIRPDDTPANGDLRMSDLGRFQIATVGMQGTNDDTIANFTIGELWVTYEVEFYKPQLNEVGAAELAIWQTVSTAPTLASPFGPFTAPTLQGSSGIGVFSNGNKFTFRPYAQGVYVFNIQYTGTTPVALAGILAPTFTDYSGLFITSENIFGNGATFYGPTLTGTAPTGTKCFAQFALKVEARPEDNPAYFTCLMLGAFATGSTCYAIHVYKLPNRVAKRLATRTIEDYNADYEGA